MPGRKRRKTSDNTLKKSAPTKKAARKAPAQAARLKKANAQKTAGARKPRRKLHDQPAPRGKAHGKRKRRTGGSIGAGGYGYQDRCAAYIAVHMLASRELPFDWSADHELRYIAVEVQKSLVDFVVTSVLGGSAFVEAKSGVKLNSAPFKKATENFVELFLNLLQSYNRPFNRNQDRLILAVGKRTEEQIKTDLREVLRRFESEDGRPELDDAPTSKKQEKAFDKLLGVVRAKWKDLTGTEPSNDEISEFLHCVRIVHLELGAREAAQGAAIDVLSDRVAGSARAAWEIICGLARRAAELANAGFGPVDVSNALQGAQIEIAWGPQSVVSDIRSLEERSLAEASALEERTRLVVGGQQVSLRDEIAHDLLQVVDGGSTFLTGVPGAGKSRTMLDLFRSCAAIRRPCVLAPVGSTLGESLASDHAATLRALRAWSQQTGRPGILLLDGFDQARAADRRQPYLELVRRVGHETDWVVVTAMRQWDLEQLDGSPDQAALASVFQGSTVIPERYQARRVSRLRAFCVPLLSDSELQIAMDAGSDALNLALQIERINELARTPFNLELLNSLTEKASTAEIGATNTQPRLIDLYWKRRVLAGDRHRELESVVSLFASEMLTQRRTTLSASAIENIAQLSQAIDDLVQSGVLEQTRVFGTSGEEQFAFSHTLLFDYAVASYVLVDANRRRQALADGATLTLITPSIQMYFDLCWDGQADERRAFYWDQILDLASDQNATKISLVLALSSAARKAASREELRPLVEALDSARRSRAITAVDALIRSVQASRISLAARGGEPWAVLLSGLASGASHGLDAAGTTYRLQQALLDNRATLDGQVYRDVGASARALLGSLLEQ